MIRAPPIATHTVTLLPCTTLFRSGYVLTFRSEETKNGDEINLELPPAMTSWIDFYLRVHRKALLARGDGRETRSLWINRWGTPASEHVIRDQIEKRTSDAFGRHVWPHLFRAIAGTGFVDHAPAQMALLPALLGHRTVQTSHRYYLLSTQIGRASCRE